MKRLIAGVVLIVGALLAVDTESTQAQEPSCANGWQYSTYSTWIRRWDGTYVRATFGYWECKVIYA